MSNIREKLTNELLYLYNTGKLHHAYRTFGAHISDGGVQFTLWAPDVKSVRVTGDFNNWDASAVMESIGDTGVWTCFVPGAKAGDHYKYEIETAKGVRLSKADPFAFMSVKRPGTDSIVTELWYEWHDDEWMKARESKNNFTSPMNIYECHLGSWKRPEGPEGKESFFTYRQLADMLVPYVKEMGYTHVEFLPVMEHPLDASWGNQVTGFYAPTSRYGSAHGLKYLIETFHKEGIGVILDWVPGHFCPDDHGLRAFNGDKLYESIVHPDWGTYKFDYSRPQVRSFLLSNAMYWLDEYHADGLRVDGVTSMLYLNFGISDKSKMRFNKYGGETDLEAVEFLKEFNYMIGNEVKGAVTVAEESTAWPMVTQPPSNGGLGFHFKWNMGWMNDTLEYMSTDFPWREGAHNKLTFSMTYAYSENYILPLSHDEVVHGKKSLIGRMPGDIWRQFAGTRLLAMYQMTHPGKKLNFMGHEIAQFIEWREYEGLEWFLLGYENHEKHQRFIKDLNHIYTENPALWSDDNSWEGFKWIDPDDRRQKVLTFLRHSRGTSEDDPGELLICAFNMGVEAFDEFEIGVPEPGYYKEIINSDNVKYAGSGRVNTRQVRAKKKPRHGMPYSITIKMPVVGAAIFKKNYKRKGH
jgi:1,4-alpha-glucan branching enzyme